MRMRKVSRGLFALLVSLMFVTPMAAMAQEPAHAPDEFEWYVEPAADRADTIAGLFNGVMLVALFVFVFVEALMLYIIFRFRKNKTTPQGEHHRGHTKAEIMWTIIPAVILIIIGIASVSALQEIDVVPEDTDFSVNVTASQFAFIFEYPDGSTSPNLVVQEGARVQLNVTSVDVIHALWIPEFALKIDAVPGRTNQVWFEAPAVPDGTEVREFWIQCAEYCGRGHHTMGWGNKVVVFQEDATRPPFGDVTIVETDQVEMQVGNIFDPTTIRVDPGTTVTWTNADSSGTLHTVTPEDKQQWGTEGSGDDVSQWMATGTTYQFTFTEPGTYEYYCIPHAGTMRGTVIVGNATAEGNATA